MRVCLYVLCGHLLGKGWPLGSRLWCLLWVCHFPIGILGQVWYLIVSIPDLCTLTYFEPAYHEILVSNIWAASLWEVSDEPVYPCSLTRVFATGTHKVGTYNCRWSCSLCKQVVKIYSGSRIVNDRLNNHLCSECMHASVQLSNVQARLTVHNEWHSFIKNLWLNWRFSLALTICESWALFFVSSWCVNLIRVFLHIDTLH